MISPELSIAQLVTALQCWVQHRRDRGDRLQLAATGDKFGAGRLNVAAKPAPPLGTLLPPRIMSRQIVHCSSLVVAQPRGIYVMAMLVNLRTTVIGRRAPVEKASTGKHGEIMDPAISKPHEALAHWQATKSL